jgi:hypothetical protein
MQGQASNTAGIQTARVEVVPAAAAPLIAPPPMCHRRMQGLPADGAPGSLRAGGDR